MALTKARPIYGETALKNELEEQIRTILTAPHDPQKLLSAVHDMRLRIEKQHPARSIWDCKYVRGGLYDLDFLAQYLQLLYAPEQPDVIQPSSEEVFEMLAQVKLIPEQEKDELIAAARLLRRVQNFLRLIVSENFDEAKAGPSLKAALAKATDMTNFEELKDALTTHAQIVTRYYRKRIETPARDLMETGKETG